MKEYPLPFLYYYAPKKKRSRTFTHRVLRPYKNLMIGFTGVSIALGCIIIY